MKQQSYVKMAAVPAHYTVCALLMKTIANRLAYAAHGGVQ
jgi:hypothetical protein